MEYEVGKIGRCMVVRFADGDDILAGLAEIAEKEGIRAAVFYLVGGLAGARIVVGPETDEMPPVPVWRTIDESHEMVGVGTIFPHDGKPAIHLHGAYGKRDSVKAGCMRGEARAFLVLEAVILEMEGITATREPDPVSGMTLLRIVGRK
jgi:predicted DNA-binding protein with PD1-like motif